MGLFGNLFASFKVDIRCDLSRNVFFPGNVIEGVVIVQARSPIDFRAVRLKLAGKQRVCITRTHTRQHHHNGETRTETYTEHHVSTAVVYKQLVTLAGNMKYAYNTNGTYPMPNGTFYYPFSVQLPNDLPPSVTRRQGGHSSEIYFYAKAYVDIPMGRDAVSKAFFSVLRPMPVSQWLSKGPIQDERQFHVTCCCCIDKGYVKARLFMDRTVIAIDRDNINVYADVDNTLGKEPVKSLIVNLRAVMTNFAQGHTEKFIWNQAHAVIANHIPAGQKGIIQGVLHLPRNALPTFASPHSNVSYSIMAELEIPMASNPSASFPVVVAQSIDESNYCTPIRWGECSYRVYPKRSACPEFYYLPPQHPVYAVNTIPMNGMAPPPPQFYMPPPQITIGIPNSEWVRGAAPFVPLGIKEHHVANGPVSPLQWQVGVQQPEMRFTAITQEQPGSGSPVTPMHEDGKGYGSIATPLM